jgi:ribosome-associated protein
MREWDDKTESAEEEAPSKSALKRRMIALQKLGETLVELSEKQLEKIPVDDERLVKAVREARAMRSHSARRRHLQLIGKLMRDIDAGAIEKALQAMDNQRREDANSFHQLEQLRDEVLATGAKGTELVMERWPDADRQQLRQLILQHQREARNNKPPTASRKLYRLLKELAELHGDAG